MFQAAKRPGVGAQPSQQIDLRGGKISNEYNAPPSRWQAMRIARRHRVSLHHANLICGLQNMRGVQ